MKTLQLTFALLALAVTQAYGATITNIPISSIPTATNVNEDASFLLIQKYLGRTTNDTFRATKAIMLSNVGSMTVTNLGVTNLTFNSTVITNIVQSVGGSLWTDFGAFIAPTGFSDIFGIATNGTIFSGKNTLSLEGGSFYDGALIEQVLDVSQGDPSTSSFKLNVIHDGSAWSDFGAIEGGISTNSAQVVISTTVSNVGSGVILNSQEHDASVKVSVDSYERSTLAPAAADGVTPYIFDTSVAHATGNLAEIQNNGTNVFAVSALSGYDGTGDLFLSSDGTYKSAGGGGTNYWKIASSALTPQDNTLPVELDGKLRMGEHWRSVTNLANVASSQIVAWNDVSQGDTDAYELLIGAYTDASNYSFADVYGYSNGSTLGLSAYAGATNNLYGGITVDPGYFGTAQIVLSGNQSGRSAQFFLAEPSRTSGTPYILDTTSDHTSGNLLEVKNNDSDTFVVTANGALLLTPMTKTQKSALTPVEGMLVFQSDNTPGLRIYQNSAWRMVTTEADP